MKVYHLILIGQFIWLMVVRFDSVSAFQSTAPSHQCYRFAKVPGDPCAKLNCEFGAECVVARGARNASCQCIEQCYTYGDTVDSGPVCGSDGVDYASLCELRRASCAKLEYISIQFDGKCGSSSKSVRLGQELLGINRQFLFFHIQIRAPITRAKRVKRAWWTINDVHIVDATTRAIQLCLIRCVAATATRTRTNVFFVFRHAKNDDQFEYFKPVTVHKARVRSI